MPSRNSRKRSLRTPQGSRYCDCINPFKSLRIRSGRALGSTELLARIAHAIGGPAPVFRASGPVAGHHSQVGQDYFLDQHVFRGLTGGTFVDVGAHDGVTFSNTLYLEAERGWTGVCIEPQPNAFARLQQSRSSVCVQAAISDRPGIMPFVVGEGEGEMLSGLAASYDARHLSRIAGTGMTTIDVEVRRLDEVLWSSNVGRVHLLSIDVEGGELGVLKSIDLVEFGRPVVVMENNYRSWPQVREMRRQGYQLLCRIEWDEVFIPIGMRLS